MLQPSDHTIRAMMSLRSVNLATIDAKGQQESDLILEMRMAIHCALQKSLTVSAAPNLAISSLGIRKQTEADKRSLCMLLRRMTIYA